MSTPEKELTELMIGVAKTQAAIIEALHESDINLLSKILSRVGGVAGHGKKKLTTTYQNLPAQMLLKALASPSPNGPTLEQFAHQKFEELSDKT